MLQFQCFRDLHFKASVFHIFQNPLEYHNLCQNARNNSIADFVSHAVGTANNLFLQAPENEWTFIMFGVYSFTEETGEELQVSMKF